ncbi:MAG: hypothetical protein Q4B09_03085, partial [Lachnospiraceae bacterium]|nr:hypothetical protein [Lachnospiraceae bacterium]
SKISISLLAYHVNLSVISEHISAIYTFCEQAYLLISKKEGAIRLLELLLFPMIIPFSFLSGLND